MSTLSLEQTVNGFVVGQKYQLSYDENARGSTATPLVEVDVGGTPVVIQHLDTAVGGSNPFRVVDSILFTAGSTSEQVRFQVSQVSGGDDATALIDNVTITAIPEPASLVQLLGLGAVGLIAVGLSRRKA